MVFATFNRRRVHASLIAGLGGLIAVSTSGCVEDQDFLIVERAVWFTDSEECLLSDSDPTPLGMTIDVAYDTRIGMGFLVTNNTSPNAGSNSGIDDSELSVDSVEVRLSFSGGSIEGGSFEQTLPSVSIGSEESATFLVHAPTEVTDSLRAAMAPGQFETLEMEVVFKGRTYGQAGKSKLGEVETRAYTFPFEVCYGCLTDCSCAGGCPTQSVWEGTCSFAQGGPVQAPPGCDAPEEPDDSTTGP